MPTINHIIGLLCGKRQAMTCHNCEANCRRFGRTRKGQQRYRCDQCRKTFSEPRNEHLGGMYTAPETIEQIVRLFVEGCSVRSIERITGVHRDTILHALVIVGNRCARLAESIRNVRVKDVQCDEIWGFVGCKEKHNHMGNPEFGDAYCFVGIERHSKLILAWHLGRRTAHDAFYFAEKLNAATDGHFQVSTDGFQPYFDALHTCVGDRTDYAQLIKVYGVPTDADHRYSPAKVIEVIAKPSYGNPDFERLCTSHVERQNLTMRMHIRRLTRLTNAFSKKRGNLLAALALHFAWYNFVRVHQTIRVTPAMEAGITNHVWSIAELLGATRN